MFESPSFIHGKCVKPSQVRYRQSSVLSLVPSSCRRLCDSPEVEPSMISNQPQILPFCHQSHLRCWGPDVYVMTKFENATSPILLKPMSTLRNHNQIHKKCINCSPLLMNCLCICLLILVGDIVTVNCSLVIWHIITFHELISSKEMGQNSVSGYPCLLPPAAGCY